MLFTAYDLDRQTSITAPFLRVKLNIVDISHLNGYAALPSYLLDGFLRFQVQFSEKRENHVPCHTGN